METKLTVKELKNRTDENEMDLSLLGITKVPVKEIAAVTKANSLDLSCNRIVLLPAGFCGMLQHLIKLDLSKNQLENLPEDIGKLQQLQHLDLYQNKLKKIPISFSQLKNLRWLDLKENNFDSSYLNIVGDCLDDKQCRTCAVNVVKAMKSAASDQERKRQQELKIKREEEAAKKKEEEMIALEKKRTKKLEKERRKIQWEEEQKLKELAAPLEEVDNTRNVSVESEVFETIEETKSSKSCFGSCIMALFIAVTAVTVGVYFYCENHSSDQNCIVLNQTTEKIYDVLKTWLKSTLEMFNLFVDSLKDKVQHVTN